MIDYKDYTSSLSKDVCPFKYYSNKNIDVTLLSFGKAIETAYAMVYLWQSGWSPTNTRNGR